MSLEKLLDPEAFWRFSLEIYSRNKVKQLCLYCQDQHGLNVNVILLCIWLGRLKKGLSIQQCQELVVGIAASEIKLKQQRSLRSEHKKGSEQYKACLQQELELEAEQQKLLLRILAGMPDTVMDVKPINNYFVAMQIDDEQTLESLIGAAIDV